MAFNLLKKMIPVRIKTSIYSFIDEKKIFGTKVALSHALVYLFESSSNSIFLKYRHEVIMKYLEGKYKNIIYDYGSKKILKDSNSKEKLPIWVMWWQGEKNMPSVIKGCLASKRKYAGEHDVKVISKDNYKKYIEIPDYILEKVNAGNLSITHLSDIIRILLLEKYGGLWLDATILCIKPIPEEYFYRYFYSLKNENLLSKFVSKDRWTVGIIGGNKECALFQFLKECLLKYCEQENKFIDYFLLDYFVALAYRHLPEMKKIIDDVPENNINWNCMYEKWNVAYAENVIEQLKKDTCFLYMPWRKNYALKDKNGKETMYNHLIKGVKDEILC